MITYFLLGRAKPAALITTATAPGADGPLHLRVYRPRSAQLQALPVVLFIHGGGWVLGNTEMSDWLCSRVAVNVGAVVVSVEYRLAPTHRWPTAAEDCYAALLHVVSHGEDFGADTRRVAVMGESAGGNIAAVIALMARERSGPEIAVQVLIYPATDLSCETLPPSQIRPLLVVGNADVRAACHHYLEGQDPHHPFASPYFASNHRRLPRALIQVAELCPIHDDGVRYAEKLRNAGVPVTLTEYAGMPHGYLSFPNLCKCAPQAMTEICDELQSALCSNRADAQRA